MLIDHKEIPLLTHYDAFIASASYESRSLTVLKMVSPQIIFDHKFVSLSVTHRDLIQNNLNEFVENGFSIIEVNNNSQFDTFTNLADKLGLILDGNKDSTFLIDVTTFSRQTLLILFRLLRIFLNSNNTIHFLYSPAKDYSIGLGYSEKWLSKGVLSICSVFGYSGIIRPSKPYHLIILLGYEVERASSLINSYEPSRITIGYAKIEDSISNEHFNLNKLKFEQLAEEFPNVFSFEFSSSNVIECKNEILKQVDSVSDYNTVISPMNNKISTISCALAAFENKNIQVAIAIPAIYNYENYSEPSTELSLIELPNLLKS